MKVQRADRHESRSKHRPCSHYYTIWRWWAQDAQLQNLALELNHEAGAMPMPEDLETTLAAFGGSDEQEGREHKCSTSPVFPPRAR